MVCVSSIFSMATAAGNLGVLQLQLENLRIQLDQQRIAQDAATNAAATNAVNAVEMLQLPPF